MTAPPPAPPTGKSGEGERARVPALVVWSFAGRRDQPQCRQHDQQPCRSTLDLRQRAGAWPTPAFGTYGSSAPAAHACEIAQTHSRAPGRRRACSPSEAAAAPRRGRCRRQGAAFRPRQCSCSDGTRGVAAVLLLGGDEHDPRAELRPATRGRGSRQGSLLISRRLCGVTVGGWLRSMVAAPIGMRPI